MAPDKAELASLYQQGLTQQEIADEYEVTQSAVSRWFSRMDIRTGWGERVAYRTDSRGYEVCDPQDGFVQIHRLVAVAHHGLEAVAGGVVHHMNGIPWDNRPVNLEVMDRSSHATHHGLGTEIQPNARD